MKKAFTIIECLGSGDGALSLDEISQKTGLSKSTAHRILHQLAEMNYIVKKNRRYEISVKFLALVKSTFHQKRDIQDIVQKYLIELRDSYRESVNFAVWERKQAVLIAAQPSLHAFRIVNQLGQIFPLHCTSIGKVIAAHLPRETVEELLGRDGMPRKTPKTIIDREVYRKEIEWVKEQSYALDDEESVEGVRCVAVPIFRSGNIVYGGMSISGPTSRMAQDIIAQMVKDLQITGYRISFDLSSAQLE